MENLTNDEVATESNCWHKTKNFTATAENIFSLFMLSVFFYTSLKYLYDKYFDKKIDESLFWNIFNHLTPLFVARGLQINICSFIHNIKKSCQKKSDEHNSQLNQQPLLNSNIDTSEFSTYSK